MKVIEQGRNHPEWQRELECRGLVLILPGFLWGQNTYRAGTGGGGAILEVGRENLYTRSVELISDDRAKVDATLTCFECSECDAETLVEGSFADLPTKGRRVTLSD